jgi:3-oxoacyl-[acyl-carrier protein] reductase
MDLELSGKNIIITGGNRGIGRAAALRLAEEHTNLFLVARDGRKLEDAAADIAGKTGRLPATLSVDMSDPDSHTKITRAAHDHFGAIDILVSAAGDTRRGDLFNATEQDWTYSFAVKFHATVRLMRACAEIMNDRGEGRIVIVAGSSGREPDANSLPVGAVNAALMSVVRGASRDLARRGITITAINPGAVITDRFHRRVARLATATGKDASLIAEELARESPLGRVANADEIADWIAFLCSAKAIIANGEAITLDGGTRRGI